MLGTFEAVPGAGRDITVVRTGLKLDGEPPAVSAPPPQLGQDNASVYGALGIDGQELERMKKDGII